MRRILFTAIAFAVVSTGLGAVPAVAGGVEPTVINASASPKSQLIKLSSPPTLEVLNASFDDPDASIATAAVTVRWPGGKSTYSLTGSTVGSTRSFALNYPPTNANAPGVYKVSFKAVPKAGITYATPHVARTSFVIKHQTRLIVSAQAPSPKRGVLVRFSGSFYPHYSHAKGKKLILSYDKAGAPKRFVKVRTTEVTKYATYRFDRIRVYKTGKWRVTFKGDRYSNKSAVTMKYTVA